MSKRIVSKSLDEVSNVVVANASRHGLVGAHKPGVGAKSGGASTKTSTQRPKACGLVSVAVEAKAQGIVASVEAGAGVERKTTCRLVLIGCVAKQAPRVSVAKQTSTCRACAKARVCVA